MKECEICQGSEFKDIVAQERMYDTGDIFNYIECESCQALFLTDIPADLGKYYPSNYYSFGSFNRSNALLALLKKLRYEAFCRGLSFHSPVYYDWLSPLSLNPKSKIADIGCGNGQLLAEMAYSGFKQLNGYDPFVKAAFSSKNFSIYKKDFFEIDQKFDLVMFHHSFEHLPSPVEVFKKLVTILNPEGQVLIRVPVTDAQVWKEEHTYWFQLDAPRHLFIPNTKSMEILGERFGLELFNTTFDSMDSQFWGTALYKKGKPLVGTEIHQEFSRQELTEFRNKALQYNKLKIGDQACFYYKKKAQ
ncbi:class I SAM-dependent methyltransferase [Cyclobacterium marinum]|uniref:Methyltransferase type 11 n=1 Tax=Cyclobacterium marinum (strain ATCC 25205 / DSM 745 / LMG 13164 / NCIMB 1802) TaxID=880070 RepID=G0IV71_CYCMS|nr:class I SAM-dependent methyltransferase [Cyclobacterium marinum]AEL27062.1 Methyltransferase type 11 [Cyclobacterium marinum DSM 745]